MLIKIMVQNYHILIASTAFCAISEERKILLEVMSVHAKAVDDWRGKPGRLILLWSPVLWHHGIG